MRYLFFSVNKKLLLHQDYTKFTAVNIPICFGRFLARNIIALDLQHTMTKVVRQYLIFNPLNLFCLSYWKSTVKSQEHNRVINYRVQKQPIYFWEGYRLICHCKFINYHRKIVLLTFFLSIFELSLVWKQNPITCTHFRVRIDRTALIKLTKSNQSRVGRIVLDS